MRKIVLLLLSGFLFAQGNEINNVRFVGQLAYPYSSDVWGYIAPNGHEFALLGLHDGTAVIDVSSNPAQPVETGMIPGAGSIWRDLKVHEHYCYVTNETGGGLAIIDLADPYNPVLANQYSTTFQRAHNLYITDGYAYIFGSNAGVGGVRILDLADPVNPVEVGSWEDDYFHDGYVRNDTLYGCGIYTGTLYILDVSDKTNPVTMVAKNYNSYGCHQVWISDDSRYAYTADEQANGIVYIWDIQDFSNINLLSTFSVGTGKSVHNLFYRDGILIISYYVFGTRFVDVSDPANPVEVGYFDFYEGSNGLYNGNWGTFPFTNSGLVFSSDMNGNGLVVMSYPFLGDIHYDQLNDTENIYDPVELTFTITPSDDHPVDLNTIAVVAGLNGTDWDTLPASPTGNPNEYVGVIPGPGADGTMNYYARFSTIDGYSVETPYGAPASTFSYNVGTDQIFPIVHSVTQLNDDFYPTGSATVYASAVDNIGIDLVELTFWATGGEQTTVTCEYNSSTDQYFADVFWENAEPGATIHYFITATDASQAQNATQSNELSFGILQHFILSDFEDPGQLSRWNLTDGWGRQYINANYGYGLNDSPQSVYAPNTVSSCSLLEPFNLTFFSHAYLRFSSLTALEAGADFGYVELSTDAINWETAATVTGLWQIEEVYIDLDPLLSDSTVWVRFKVVSDGQNQYQGWFLDNVTIVLNEEMPAVTINGEASLPGRVALLPNYPNPFNPSTMIRFVLDKTTHVTVSIFDILGREVCRLVDEQLGAGYQSALWNGMTTDGVPANSGVYIVRLKTEQAVTTQKVMLVK